MSYSFTGGGGRSKYNGLNKIELKRLISERLATPGEEKLTHQQFIELSRMLICLRWDEDRPHRATKWIQERAQKLEVTRHVKRAMDLGMRPVELGLAGEVAALEAEEARRKAEWSKPIEKAPEEEKPPTSEV